LSTIAATGTLEPEELIDVGAQVAGRIKEFGIEPSELKGRKPDKIDPAEKAKLKRIDYNSVVNKGTILAWIDDSIYQAQVDQAEAALKRSEADVLQFQAKYAQAEQEWKRAQTLRPANAIADTDYDLAQANVKAAKANVEVSEAVVNQNKAALKLAKTNLEYTVIRSPVDGKVIDRRVNIGQTVVASLNAPSIFLIGKDLRKMEIWASVNEADIGRIRVGMPVRFSVDAHPGETFRGTVKQIRLNATTAQNVVLYTVVISTDNSDGRLLPYLTANVQFEIEERKNVLLVPNAALRWKPRPQQIAPDSERKESRVSQGKDADDRGRVWVQNDEFVSPIDVQVGLNDGTMTEIGGENIKEGMEVVIGERRKDEAATAAATNPFVPQIRFGRQRSRQ
jgi:HlyD family secretion protein